MKEPVKAPISPRRTSRIQTSESRQVGAAAEPAAGGVLEAPEWVTKLVAFDRRYSKWVHETFLTNLTFISLRFFEFRCGTTLAIPLLYFSVNED